MSCLTRRRPRVGTVFGTLLVPLLVTLPVAGGAPALTAQTALGSRWEVRVTTTPNPLPAGRCAAIWVEVVDNNGYRRTTLADGRPLDPRTFHYATSDGSHFQWRNGDPASGYICSAPATGAVQTTVTVTMLDGTSGTVPLANIPAGQTARPTMFRPQAPLWRPGLASGAPAGASTSSGTRAANGAVNSGGAPAADASDGGGGAPAPAPSGSDGGGGVDPSAGGGAPGGGADGSTGAGGDPSAGGAPTGASDAGGAGAGATAAATPSTGAAGADAAPGKAASGSAAAGGAAAAATARPSTPRPTKRAVSAPPSP